ncbi:oxygen-insensitive NADPH nitroreductase [Salipaludibacillus sp. CF4.18]|uniref:oxygen-insensitive NADPH nitroreductase n=1 Tax=Salipaludibacillus sp. CF4.18 TaxID=3373081 RepID=UPI003EE62347
MLNDTIKTILSHRSIRKFTDESLSDEQIKLLVESAQMASTSSFIQAYTIIGVEDHSKKRKLSELAGNQPYVETNGHFFVFCADLYRHRVGSELEETNVEDSLESTEKFMVSLIDASLAAQNAAIAAESMGLGICYIGGLRNDITKVSELLNLPDYVIPLFGLAVGVPATKSDQKPRLPIENIYYKDAYPSNKDAVTEGLHHYNDIISDYYHNRTSGKRSDRWTEQVSQMLSQPSRPDMKDFVNKKGFMKS